MQSFLRYATAGIAACALLLSESCTKEEPIRIIDGNGSPKGYLVEVSESFEYPTIDRLMEYLSASNTGDDTGIIEKVMEMYYSGEIASLALRNYIDVGKNIDGSWKLKFEKYDFTYNSVDSYGKPVVLSGTVIFPNNTEDASRDYELDNITLYSTFYQQYADDCPSVKGCPAMLRVLFNSMVVMPDFQGYGASADMRHPYFEYNTLARQALDCELAAIELAASKGVGFAKDCGTYNMGASKGGGTALAVHKMLETKEKAPVRRLINLRSTYCSAAAIDADAILRNYASQRILTSPWMLAMMVNSAYYSNTAMFGDYKLSDLMSEKFNTYSTTRNGSEYSLMTMMESLKFSTDELTREYLLNGFTTTRSILSYDIAATNTVMKDSELYKILKKISDNNNPALGWKPEKKILIEHSKADECIPFNTTFNAYEELRYSESGAQSGNVEFGTLNMLSHKATTADAVLKMISHKDPANRQ